LEINEKIKSIETDNKKLEKQIDRFQTIYEDNDDKELLKLTLVKEKELNTKKEKNDILLGKLKIEIEDLDTKFDRDKLELTYYDVKEKIIDFFENMNKDEKRTSLVKIIKCCQLFGKYIVIDTGKLLFIFNLDKKCVLSDEIYSEFKKDKKFKDNFLNSSSVMDVEGKLMILNDWIYHNKNYQKKDYVQKKLSIQEQQKRMKNLDNYWSVRKLGDLFIQEIFLKDKSNIDIKTIMKEKLQNIGIDYPLSEIEKIISFTEL